LNKVQTIGSQTCKVYGPLFNFKKLCWPLHTKLLYLQTPFGK